MRWLLSSSSLSLIGVVAICLSLGATNDALGQVRNPLKKLVSFQRVAADANEAYPIEDTNGPWMILATTFRGEKAMDDAKALVYEFRKTYKLPAYTYEVKLDFSKPVDVRGVDRFGNPRKGKYQNNLKTKEVAVLVGDYPALDDRAAQAALERVQKIEPKSLMPDEKGQYRARPFGNWRLGLNMLGVGDRKSGPMFKAFITTNPILPPEHFVPPGLDPFVEKLNKNVEHSLLDCPKKYSIQVAMFTGKYKDTDTKKTYEEFHADDDLGKLERGAAKAHRMTVLLRAKGYEAYEFHDRYASMVYVGGFDKLGRELPDGQIDLDPRIVKIMNTFGAKSKEQHGGYTALKTIDGINFMAQPIPVEVPRQSAANVLARQRD